MHLPGVLPGLLLTLCLVFALIPVTARAAETGNCGAGANPESVKWKLENGTLTISGSGAMASYSDNTEQPWETSQDSVTSVVIEDGVTAIGDSLFSGMTSLKKVTIGTRVESIGHDAFGDCSGLTEITIPASVTSIGDGVFANCKKLNQITVAEGSRHYRSDNGVWFDKAGNRLIAYPVGEWAGFLGGCNKLEAIYLLDIWGLKSDLLSKLPSGADPTIYSIKLPPISRIYDGKAVTDADIQGQVFIKESGGTTETEIAGTWKFAEADAAYTKIADSGVKMVVFTPTDPTYAPIHTSLELTIAPATAGGGGGTGGGSSSGGGGGSSSGTVATPETKIDPADAQNNLFGTANTIDITGKERSETSMLLADQVKKALGVEKFSTIILASGTDFPDGLGVSALSIQQKAPVLIVTPGTEAAIKKYIEENLVYDGRVIISGGTGAVSQNMQNSLNGIEVGRLGGADRYQTNIRCNRITVSG